ncbi:transposase [Streptomyces sp. ISL-112]|nr:transposase [Streptomyces sp. ISL-112]MBT2462830.1 transposase [Streptomyces sp. ISL-63]
MVGHAGARLLADLADATGLTAAYSAALRPLRPRGTGHDPGRIATDLAVMLADGGEAIADLAVLRDQGEVFGAVASTPTAWRLLADTDERTLTALRSARAQAREIAWLQAVEQGEDIPAVRAAGRMLPGLVLDLDATLVACHSEKDQAAPTYKGSFGFHPLLCFLAITGEGLSGRLRPGNAGASTASDHITVLDQALAQIPDVHRHGTDILVRTDSAGSARRPSSPTSETYGNEKFVPPSQSDTRSPSLSATRSEPYPTVCGIPPWTRTARSVPAPRSPS